MINTKDQTGSQCRDGEWNWRDSERSDGNQPHRMKELQSDGAMTNALMSGGDEWWASRAREGCHASAALSAVCASYRLDALHHHADCGAVRMTDTSIFKLPWPARAGGDVRHRMWQWERQHTRAHHNCGCIRKVLLL